MLLIESIFCWVVAFIMGSLLGNYATTFYFRTPRGIPLYGVNQPPMCSNCGIKLKIFQCNTVYYYLFCSKYCNNCGIKIPFVYALIEGLISFLILFNFFLNSFNQASVMIAFLIPVLVIIIALDMRWHQMYERMLWIFLLFTVLLLSLTISNINDMLYNIVITFSLSAILVHMIQLLYLKITKIRIDFGYEIFIATCMLLVNSLFYMIILCGLYAITIFIKYYLIHKYNKKIFNYLSDILPFSLIFGSYLIIYF